MKLEDNADAQCVATDEGTGQCPQCGESAEVRLPGLAWCPGCGAALLVVPAAKGVRFEQVKNDCGRQLERLVQTDLEVDVFEEGEDLPSFVRADIEIDLSDFYPVRDRFE